MKRDGPGPAAALDGFEGRVAAEGGAMARLSRVAAAAIERMRAIETAARPAGPEDEMRGAVLADCVVILKTCEGKETR